MDIKNIKSELEHIEKLIGEVSCIIEVVAGSCNYNDLFSQEKLLLKAHNMQLDIVEKLYCLEMKFA